MLQVKYLAEFQANTTTVGAQTDATVTALADGRFVIAWTDASGTIRGRIFNADESPTGNDFVIGTAATANTGHVSLTALSGGGFAAAWQEDAAGHLAIVAQVFDGNGASGTPFQVSAPGADYTLANVVQVGNAIGNLEFTYHDLLGGSGPFRAQYGTDGTPVVTEAIIPNLTPGDHAAEIANLGTSKYVVVSTAAAGDGDIQAQIFTSTGTAVTVGGSTAPFAVNTTLPGLQDNAHVTQLADGKFAVTWESTGTGANTEIRARIFNADGTASTANDFSIYGSATGNEINSTIAAVNDGAVKGFVVAWLDTADHTIKAQFVDNNGGMAAGTQFRVDTNVIDNATAPQIATLADGRFVVSWTAASDTDGTGIHAQIFDPRTAGVTLTGSGTLDDSLVGTAFNDTIRGNGGNDTLHGGAGVDFIDGGVGADHMVGGDGNDDYVIDNLGDANNPGDTITETVTGGTDLVQSSTVSIDLRRYANTENAALTGAAANLSIIGTDGNNVIYADQANATNTAANTLTGGGGNDTYYVGSGDTVVEELNGGYDKVIAAEVSIDAAIANVEEIDLTGSLAIDATGNAGNNVLRGDGNSAINILTGLAGNDTYYLGAGDKIVEALGAAGGNDWVVTAAMNVDLGLAPFRDVENADLTGTTAGRNAIGTTGNNILRGDHNTQINMLTGLAGDDTYYIGAGDKIVEALGATGGNDTVSSSTLSLDLKDYLNVENVELSGTATGRTATGNAGNNTIHGDTNSTANILTGLAGNDTYYVGAGDSIVEAATAAGGIDWVIASDQSIDLRATKFLNVENAVLTDNGSTTLFNAIGSLASNILRGDQSSKVNILTGLAGNDTYYLGAGDKIVEAAGPGGGVDWVITADQSVDLRLAKFLNVENVVLTDNGSNTLFNAIGSLTDNLLRGDQSNKANILTGLAGNDTYYLGAGDRIVEALGATGGTDTVVSSSISLNLASYANVENIELIGRDPALGPNVALTATGNAGDNLISADRNTAGDTLQGLGGNDRYVVGAGDKIIELANAGNDTVYSAKISLNLGLPAFANVENAYIVGAAVGLNATGNAGNNVLSGEGNTTANSLTGLAGNDFYIVGLNDKIVETSTGGNDTVASSTININLGLPACANVENVQLDGNLTLSATGNAKANTLTGETNSAANILTGLGGNDTYFVGVGDKIIEVAGAGGGKDTVVSSTVSLNLNSLIYSNVEQAVLQGTAKLDLTGNAGVNLLQGNDGANVILGGMGGDTLVGNSGSDTFKFNFTAESGITNATRDVITDFKHGIDKIDLSVIDANGAGAGNTAFAFLAANGAPFTGVAGQVHWAFNSTNTLVEADTNADGVPDFQLLLVGHVSLTSTDFLL
jgi:Ca2+-binding RTX toxin-like protein